MDDKTLLEDGQLNNEFFNKVREMIYACGGTLLSAGLHDQHFALSGKQYCISINILGDDF